MMGLTSLQRDALRVIQELTIEGISPTWQTIADELDLASRSQVSRILYDLVERGRICWPPSTYRTVVAVLAPVPVPDEDFAVELTEAGRLALAQSDQRNG